MTFAALYAILVGILMITQWAFFLATKQVPELETEPARIIFHLAAELITAVVLLVGGWGLLTNSTWGSQVYLVSMGMLLYTVINSSGYFAQIREWSMIGVFVILLMSTLISLSWVFQME